MSVSCLPRELAKGPYSTYIHAVALRSVDVRPWRPGGRERRRAALGSSGLHSNVLGDGRRGGGGGCRCGSDGGRVQGRRRFSARHAIAIRVAIADRLGFLLVCFDARPTLSAQAFEKGRHHRGMQRTRGAKTATGSCEERAAPETMERLCKLLALTRETACWACLECGSE